MNYGEVLGKSWKIIWKHKILWLFGLLASCGRGGGGGGGGSGSGGGGGNGGNYNFGNGSGNPLPFENLPPWVNNLVHTIQQMVQDGTIWPVLAISIAVLVVFFLLLWAVFFALGTMGRIGLARGAWLADSGEETLTFGGLWRESLHYFWRALGLILLVSIGTTVAILVLLAPFFLITILTLGIGLLCLIPFICLLIPVGFAIQVIEDQALVAIVGEDLGIFDSLRRAWDVARSNIGPLVVMALILLVGGGIAGVIIGLPVLLILGPIIVALVVGNQAVMLGGFAIAAIMFLIYLPVAIILNSGIQAYMGSAWVLTYRRLTIHPADAAIVPEFPVEPAAPATL